ncbi:hypothetical protein ACFLYO_03500 [Chloroflexota bacterium]
MSKAEALWEINNEYRKRLSLLMGHMNLLEQILKMQDNAEPALRAAIRHIRATLEDIDADHHNWRHTHFYQPEEGSARRRMVDADAAIMKALQTFTVTLSSHLRHFDAIAETMAAMPQPDPALTRVIKGGNLWDMCLNELEALAAFDVFVHDMLSR